MLHVRYDWRRPAIWIGLSLTFFLSSQDTHLTKDNPASFNQLNKRKDEILIAHNNRADAKTADKISPFLFYAGKR
jgi:hypothetical protein